MRAAIISEYRKFFSTRAWWILSILMVGGFLLLTLGAGWVIGWQLRTAGRADLVEVLSMWQPVIFGLGIAMGYLFPVIIGALAVTSEYRHNTVVPTFLGEPRRSVVMVAKAIAAVPMGFVVGLLATGSCIAGGSLGLKLGGIPQLVWTSQIALGALQSVLALTVWTMIGVGLGMLITNQVGVIVTVLAFTQLIEPILRIGLSMSRSTAPITKYLPGAASDALGGGHSIFSIIATAGRSGQALTSLQGGVVLAAYGLVFALVGYLFRIRRSVA
ncbi:MAG: ABC transporter permease [Propionibacteriaceae bacterium]|jgi:hypothetical protein|nr:ABC transporter permease [Propionibacteriaceae bacterium]